MSFPLYLVLCFGVGGGCFHMSLCSFSFTLFAEGFCEKGDIGFFATRFFSHLFLFGDSLSFEGFHGGVASSQGLMFSPFTFLPLQRMFRGF